MTKTEEFSNRMEALKRYDELSQTNTAQLSFLGLKEKWRIEYEKSETN